MNQQHTNCSALLLFALLVTIDATTTGQIQKCSPNNPTTTPCPSGTTCKAMLGNTTGKGTCVKDQARPTPQQCSPNNPTTTPCPSGTTCKAMLGNTRGEGTCVKDQARPTPQCRDICNRRGFVPCGTGFMGRSSTVRNNGEIWCCPHEIQTCCGM